MLHLLKRHQWLICCYDIESPSILCQPHQTGGPMRGSFCGLCRVWDKSIAALPPPEIILQIQ
jgi:hypothetical protein